VVRRAAALLLLALLGAPSSADPAAGIDLSGARILASPGWPAALRPFLPAGRAVEPLALPLPEGPVLALGLLDRDPVARELGATVAGLKPDDDLGGGYLVDPVRGGDRPVVVILAADAAALTAARFELETFVPAEKERAPREVEVHKPDEEAGVRTASGRRLVKPRFKIRAAAGLGPGESVLDVAGARANRFWVDERTSERDLAALRDHGVEPVVVSALDATMPRELLLAWQARGVRHFVADLRRSTGGSGGAAGDLLAVRQMAELLRPGGLDELLVLPPALDDVTARGRFRGKFDAGPAEDGPRPPPDLRGMREACIGWAGPRPGALAVTRAEARQRAQAAAGVPVIFVETWMEAAAGEPLRIPSLPRGRASDLGDVLAGVVVLPGPGSADAVAAAWATPAEPDTSLEVGDVLGACLPKEKDTATFLLETAACLEQLMLGRYSDTPWMHALPKHLRRLAGTLPPEDGILLARWAAEGVAVDGSLGDASWGTAPVRTLGLPDRDPVELRALADGRRLVLGIRIPDTAALTQCRLVLRAEDGREVLDAWVPSAVDTDPPASLRIAEGRCPGAREYEVVLEHYDLRGDPYPTRAYSFAAVAVGDEPGQARIASFPALDPRDLMTGGADAPPRGALVVGR
jgi:hypothetical protein